MPDISNEIAAIQVATTGSDIRSAIVDALNIINDAVPSYYSGPYSVTPGVSSVVLPTQSLGMYYDVTVHAVPFYSGSYVLTPSTITQTFSTSGMLMINDIILNSISSYSGLYEIDPSTVDQTLSVSGLFMMSDVTIKHYDAFPVIDVSAISFFSYIIESSWSGSGPYYQEINISGITPSSNKIIMTFPTESQVSDFNSFGIETFYIEQLSSQFIFWITGSSLPVSMTLSCMVM